MTIPFDTIGSGGETLHFSHANGYPPRTYGSFLRALAGDTYTVLAAHHRPLWDDSDPWQTLHGWRAVADDLARFFDEHGLRGVTAVGHSLGAVATMYVAQLRPELIARLVLIEPVFLPQRVIDVSYDPRFDVREQPMVAAALRRRDFWQDKQEAFDRFRPKRAFDGFSDAALWEYVEHGLTPTDGGYTLTYPREWEARFYSLPPRDMWNVLPTLTQPTLGVRAAQSDTLARVAWQQWQTLQPAATFVELPAVGHMCTMEAPHQLAEIVRAWLSAG